VTDRQRDRMLAVLAGLLAISCVEAARAIEDSLLADAVGAGGVPQGVGIAMGIAALALFAKSLLGKAAVPAANPSATWHAAAWRTAGLALVLLGYAAVLPFIGYPLSISMLVLAAGRLAGASLKWPLLVCAVLAGPLLWTLFDFVLKVRMPLGSFWS
jgi:putative tricarboxylic transport membrane protein